MRFTEAWAGVAQENVVLKFTVAGLVLTNVVTAFVLTTFALKQPLVIERGGSTKSVKLSDSTATKEEIENFIRQALSQRFDSDAPIDENLFVAGEVKNRLAETKEIGSRNIKQRVIVNAVNVSSGAIAVDADRIIIAGEVKTILPFPLRVMIAAVDRSVANPYGLKVAEITKVEKKEGANAK
jgi:hypothetical protein